MNYQDLKEFVASYLPDGKIEIDRGCHSQYIIRIVDKKPVCICICNQVLLNGKPYGISNYQFELSWKEVIKYVEY